MEPVQPEETLSGGMLLVGELVLDEGLQGCGVQGIGGLAVAEFLESFFRQCCSWF